MFLLSSHWHVCVCQWDTAPKYQIFIEMMINQPKIEVPNFQTHSHLYYTSLQGGAPQVMSWFISLLTIDMSPIKTIVNYMPTIANYRFKPNCHGPELCSPIITKLDLHFSVPVVRHRTSRTGLLELCGVTRVNILAIGRWRGAWRGAFSWKAETKNGNGVPEHCIYMDKNFDSMGMWI